MYPYSVQRQANFFVLSISGKSWIRNANSWESGRHWSFFTVHSFYSAFTSIYNCHLSLLVRLYHQRKSPCGHWEITPSFSSPYTWADTCVCLLLWIQSQGNDLWHTFFTQHHVLEVHACVLCGAYDSLNSCSGGSAWPPPSDCWGQ